MERDVRLSDDWLRSPPLSADSKTPLFATGPFPLTEFDAERATLNSQYNDNQFLTRQGSRYPPTLALNPPRLFRNFERPSFARIAFLTVSCVASYPVLYLLTLVAKDKLLFTVRLIVAIWCAGVGFALRYTLLEIANQHIEAATWATLIHMSYEESGMKFRDLAKNSENPTSLLSALLIFVSRFRSRETDRDSRGSYDKRPWSLFIGFFIFLAILGPMLPFLLGRIMVIETFIHSQRSVYHEVLIAGDLSQGDVNKANVQLGAFQNFARTWTLLPYGTSPPDYVEFAYRNETVYFPQPRLSQFVPGGSGLGIFEPNQTASLKDRPNNTLALTMIGNNPNTGMGTTLRYSQWGIRIHCKKLPDPKVNLIPLSNQSYTYAFLPQDLLRDLFAGHGMVLPASLTKPDLSLLEPNDTIPSGIDRLKISYLVKWWPNGVAHSFHTRTILDGASGNQGWTTVETVLIRLNTSFTPSGRFPVYSNESARDANGVETRIGYDTAVCVERYEPWIIQAYNTSVGSPAALGIVEKGWGKTSPPRGKIRGHPIRNTRYLNNTGKNPAFFVAHDNSIGQMVKDNGRDFFYVPSPTTVSFTDGAGPEGYTELSSDRFAVIRARVDAVNVLPYLAGSAPVVAQSYADETLAYVTYQPWQLIGLLALVLVLGFIGELFVPTLPLNIPRRGFEVYSWLALFQSQEFRYEAVHNINKMSLEDIEDKFSDVKIKVI